MRIYHGSLEVVARPVILPPNRKLDYGEGFYATTSERQAKEWTQRRMAEKHVACGYVNVYEFDEESLSDYECLIFIEPDEQWARFVLTNRTKRGFTHNYDIVYGPVANDRVYLQFGLYESGAIALIRSFASSKRTSWLTSTSSIRRKHWPLFTSSKPLK